MIVRLYTSVGEHLARNLRERPDDIHPSVRDWRVALSPKSEAELPLWERVAKELRDHGLGVVASWRLEEGPRAGIVDVGLPWLTRSRWDDNLRIAHRQIDLLGADEYTIDCEAYPYTDAAGVKRNSTSRTPSDIRVNDEANVRAHCERFAQRLGVQLVYTNPASESCLLTRAFRDAGVATVGVIQGNVQHMGAAELFGADRAAMLGWYHERALRMHQAMPGVVAMPQLYASALRRYASTLPATIPESWVYVGSASQFSRRTEPDIGLRSWCAYETETPINVGCAWFGRGHSGSDVLPRGKSYTAIVRAEFATADRSNLRSWTVRDRRVSVGDTVIGGFERPLSAICVRSDLATGTSFHALGLDGVIETITVATPAEMAGHIAAPGAASIETWRYPLALDAIPEALRRPFPRLRP